MTRETVEPGGEATEAPEVAAADAPETRKPRSRVRTAIQAGIGLGLAAVLIVYVLPRLAKTNWSDVWAVLSHVPFTTFVLLLVGVIVGLYCYTFTLTASLPGLKHWQALIVNVAGSSVGNLLPGGGAAGLAATYTICRSWGFSRRDISTSAIVTGVWNVLSRVALPLVAIVALFAGRDSDVPRALEDAAFAGALTGGVILAVFISILASERAAVAIGQGLDKVIGRLWRRRSMSVKSLVVDLRLRINDVVRTGWLSMTLGLLGFFSVYYVLFLICMHTTGVDLFYGQLFAAYAIGRLLTAVGLTPGGLGITESGTVAALVAWGANPADALAAVVLFSFFTHLMEIPLGAIGWAAWSVSPKKTPVEDVVAGPRTEQAT
ncbi:lysylphosphatidylglycerol synthase transmembrane domain-containing protein [Pedococcus bigeumensis]|uniref:lysylphosphatidylglycerol synthase transmembrane domain-containing protein n=1 Tax=Pedococcus bigeumensis TaxID=433644 RepID=UPI001F4FCE7E|nr:lysylphosphatidylglycerol synthase transmembrane domain-containing protein [Pedococcus bigeumensis]